MHHRMCLCAASQWMLPAKGWCIHTLAAQYTSQHQCQPGPSGKCTARGKPVCNLSVVIPQHVQSTSKSAAAELKTGLQDGWTPLHFASYWGSLKVLRYLLNSGVNVNAQDKVRCRTASLVVGATRCPSAKTWPLQDSSKHCIPDHLVLKLQSSTQKQLHQQRCGRDLAWKI